MSVELSLAGKNAIVIGGARGIGKTVSEFYARAGANLMIAGRNVGAAKEVAGELAEKYKVRTAYCGCDVANVDDINAVFEKTLETFGRLDIVVNNAGASTKVDFLEIDEKMYDTLMDVNAKGTFFVDQAAIRAMKDNGGGKIINMGSISGRYGFATNAAYTASKFAVTGITQAAANYGCQYNINVNCVCPGIIRTAIWEKLLSDHAAAGGDPEQYWQERISGIPLKRPQTEEDIAYMCLYLATPAADNITGQAINVSGGQVML